MASKVRAGAVVVAIALAFGGSGPANAVSVAKPAAAENTLTLITGDRVLLEPRGGVATVLAGKGRSGIAFAQRKQDGSTYVIPSDAMPLIAAGRVDKENHTYEGITYADPVTYRAGAPVSEKWNSGVFGPGLPANVPFDPLAGRERNEMWFELPLFSDPHLGRQGYTAIDSTTVTLSRDGKVIGTVPAPWAAFDVPGDTGTYQLTANATRSSESSKQVSATWTFRSGPTATVTALPLMAVRYAPALDNHNRAKAGMPSAFPVTVQHQVTGSSVQSVRAQVSYDDGATWRPVILLGSGAQRIAIGIHPVGATTVSLRASATDSAGNAVDQTIIGAYSLKP